MMMLIALPLALATPAPSDPTSTPVLVENPVSVEDDYPTDSFRAGEQGYVLSSVVVSPEGKALRCDTIESTGYKRLDDATCAAVLKHGRFKPARDAEGKPVHGIFNFSFFWLNPNYPSQMEAVQKRGRPFIPDLDITVAKLPQSEPGPVIIRVAVVVSAQGEALHCAAQGRVALPALASVACQEAMAVNFPTPVTDSRGAAVVSVRGVVVRFSVSGPVQ